MGGFLAGWAQGIIYFPANVAALAIVFGTQTCNLLGLSNGLIVPIAIVAAVSLTLINFAGAKAAGYVQTIATVVKLIPLALIVVFGFFHQGGGETSHYSQLLLDHITASGLRWVMLLLQLCLLMMVGFTLVTLQGK